MGPVPRATANGIEIEYETFGDPDGAPLLLIAGLGSQLLSWDVGFCELLGERGFHAVRYDNRDVGLSSRLEVGLPDIYQVLRGEVAPPYRLEDMAEDASALLDGLGFRPAHIAGASMGGFIAQLLAINHPDRVLSLTAIVSGPAPRESVPATPEGAAVLMTPPAPTHEERISQGVELRRALVGSGDPFDEEEERWRTQRALDRAFYPAGVGRQLLATLSAQPWLERLATVAVPTLVIGGLEDILIPVENARMIAAAIPGARLIEVEGMGHDLPKRVWQQVADAMAELARQSTTAC